MPTTNLQTRHRTMRATRVAAGALIWAGLLVAGWMAVRPTEDRPSAIQEVADILWDYGSAERRDLRTTLETPRFLKHGDPVFLQSAQGFEQVGVVTQITDEWGPVVGERARLGSKATEASIRLYPNAPTLQSDAGLVFYDSDQSIAWVLRTILPPDKQELLRGLVKTAVESHGEELAAAVVPILRASLRDTVDVLEDELPAALRDHREELQALGVAYQEEFVRTELVPLVQDELIPIIQQKAQPVLTDIGREIWGRVSLWRVGTRYLWDRLPLTSGTSLEGEWKRVLEKDVLPVVQSRSTAILALVQDIFKAASANEKVKATLRRGYGKVVEDPRVHSLVWGIVRQVVVDNPRLRDALVERWQGEQARAAIQLAGDRLEPTVRQIMNTLFGTQQEGITEEFAVVLRNRLLLKDRRWLVLNPGQAETPHDPTAALPVRLGGTEVDPFQPQEGR